MDKNNLVSFDSPWVRPLEQGWQLFIAEGINKTYRTGQIIYAQGQESGGLFYLHRGRIKVSIISASGTEKILAIHEAPATFGEAAAFDDFPYFATATALSPVEVYLVPKSKLARMVQAYPQCALALFQSYSRKMRLLALQVEDLSFLDSTCRIAHMLLKLASDYGAVTPEGITIALPITHQELGNVTAVSRATVTAILNSFSRAGIISKKRKRLTIRDTVRLEALLQAGWNSRSTDKGGSPGAGGYRTR